MNLWMVGSLIAHPVEVDVRDCDQGCACIPVYRWLGKPPSCPACGEERDLQANLYVDRDDTYRSECEYCGFVTTYLTLPIL